MKREEERADIERKMDGKGERERDRERERERKEKRDGTVTRNYPDETDDAGPREPLTAS